MDMCGIACLHVNHTYSLVHLCMIAFACVIAFREVVNQKG